MADDHRPKSEFRVAAVNAERMKTMSVLVGDGNPIHLYPEAAAAAGLGDRVVNPGSSNLGYVLNALTALAAAGRIERISVSFRGNVLAGDEVLATAEMLAEDAGDRRIGAAIALDVIGGSRAIEGTAVIALAPEPAAEG